VLIVFGLLLNIPILFFGSQMVGELLKKYRITIYIGAGVLVHTALEMMLEDRLVAPYVPPMFNHILPWTVAAVIMVYGIFKLRKK
jgi:predicted tellurium resistance membrane protein TerC